VVGGRLRSKLLIHRLFKTIFIKNPVTFVPAVRVTMLACCSAVALLSACGGVNDSVSTGQVQTAALSSSSGSPNAGESTAGANDPSISVSNVSEGQTVPDETAASPGTADTEGPSRLLAMSTAVSVDAGANATTTSRSLYVSTAGSDSNPGTQAAPVKTIARADALASADYTIHVAPGNYKVSAPSLRNAGILTKKSGTATARITFVSDVEWVQS
jgi:hypothetical protein